MKSVNIFRYSRGSDLNVAMFGWLIDFAKFGGDLQDMGLELIRNIIDDQKYEIKSIRTLSMYKNISLVVEVNDDYLISIEDITFAKNRCNILQKHRDLLSEEEKYLNRKKKFVYINVGNKLKSNHRDADNCVRVNRYYLLKLICKYEEKNQPLLEEYKDYLIYLDKTTHSHAWEENFEMWHRLTWEGYFEKFKEKDETSDWENISSQKGDSIILTWNRIDKEYKTEDSKKQKYSVYATIETELPCKYNYSTNKHIPYMLLKVEVLEGRYKSEIRNYVWNIIEKEKEKYETDDFTIEKTNHAIGTHMTIGKIEDIENRDELAIFIEKVKRLLEDFNLQA